MIKQKIYYVANAKMPTPKAHGIQLAKMAEAMISAGADLELVVPAREAPGGNLKKFYGLEIEIPMAKIPVLDTYKHGKFGFLLGSLTFMLGSFGYLLLKRLAGEKFIIYTIDIDQFSFLFLPMIGRPLFAEMHDRKSASLPSKILLDRKST